MNPLRTIFFLLWLVMAKFSLFRHTIKQFFYAIAQTKTLMRKKKSPFAVDFISRHRLISIWSDASNYSSHHLSVMTMISYYISSHPMMASHLSIFAQHSQHWVKPQCLSQPWISTTKLSVFSTTRWARGDCRMKSNGIDEAWKLSFLLLLHIKLSWKQDKEGFHFLPNAPSSTWYVTSHPTSIGITVAPMFA